MYEELLAEAYAFLNEEGDGGGSPHERIAEKIIKHSGALENNPKLKKARMNLRFVRAMRRLRAKMHDFGKLHK